MVKNCHKGLLKNLKIDNNLNEFVTKEEKTGGERALGESPCIIYNI